MAFPGLNEIEGEFSKKVHTKTSNSTTKSTQNPTKSNDIPILNPNPFAKGPFNLSYPGISTIRSSALVTRKISSKLKSPIHSPLSDCHRPFESRIQWSGRHRIRLASPKVAVEFVCRWLTHHRIRHDGKATIAIVCHAGDSCTIDRFTDVCTVTESGRRREEQPREKFPSSNHAPTNF